MARPCRTRATLTGVHSATLVLSPVSPADAGSYSVRVSNAIGSVTSSPALLTIFSGLTRVDGLNLGIENTPYGSIESLVEQPNGKILIGGFFKTLASETLQ
jgi:hypothetical protein